MKRLVWIGVAALAIFGVYRLNVGLEKVGEAPRAARTASAQGAWDITPTDPHANSLLQVQANGSSDTAVSCRWFKNGSEIQGQTSSTLEPGNFARGDEVEAEVTAPGGGRVRTATVHILNTPPRIVAASADLQTEPSATIVAQVSAVDADDDKVSLSYQWYKNGKPMPDTGASVAASNFQMGDEVVVAVTATDGDEESPAEKSEPIKIGSNAPDITSTPPGTLQAGRRFVYQVVVRAPQMRSVKYELVDAPAGMTIDDSGLIEWTMPALDANAHVYEVAIKVSDKTGGEAVQRFQLSNSVQKANSGE